MAAQIAAQTDGMPDGKLVLKDIAKTYGDVAALAPTSFSVKSGEFVTLLGPSGSGKTTLLMVVAGLVTPTTGQLLVNGKDITHMPVYDRDVGMVFQNYALFPHMSVFENVAFALRMRHVRETEIKTRTRHALQMIQLDHLAERYPKELSGGQQQRVAIARALIYEPAILLMDEPLGALDKRLREQMQLEIRKIHNDLRLTILYVTHDQEEALSMSDRICLMNGGKVEQLSTPGEMYFYPRSQFAANFLGEANIIACQAQPDDALVLPQGETIRIRDAVSSGNVQVLIRPENFFLMDPADARPVNRLDAVVEDIVLLGPLTRLELRYGETKLIAKIQTTGAIAHVQRGLSVTLGFAVQDAMLLPQV